MLSNRGSYLARVFGFVSLLFGLFARSRHFQGLIIYTKQVVKVKRVACRWSTIDRNGLEARKIKAMF